MEKNRTRESGNGVVSTDGQTDGQSHSSIPPFERRSSVGYNNSKLGSKI